MTDQRPIGFWLKLVDRLIDERFALTLEEHGVTRRQWQLLNVLARGNATVEALDAAVEPVLAADDGESADEHLAELVDSGWVAVTPSGYELTEHGHTALNGLSAVVQANRELASEGVTEEEYDRTLATLERIARNLGWSES
ncbi:MarR family transcriptional regulator [Lacisediminihabitans profunda]|uniref:MarR family transcriptional regulator n=1 Tax=Lacisediminihabitans profunda TaxID=2594790 RepID=A0A5C8UJ76_9MICO|nr:MarR family transcriptional regulator [Lacisediminihabitans profunda]TXN27758.1 MarR family transcriptional regulator [Lacisediminihabitans profunda]